MAHNLIGANSLRGRGCGLPTDSHSNLRPTSTGQQNHHFKLQPKSRQSKRNIPTHFLAVPLNNNPYVLSQISLFQDELLKTRSRERAEVSEIRGLDPSIVIDPRRFHLTLGVMTLEDKPTRQDGARSDCNRVPGEVECTKIVEAPPRLSTFSVEEEDTRSWRSSPTARDPLRAQSSRRPRATTSTTVNVSSSTFLNSTSATPTSSTSLTAPQLESQTLTTSSPALPTKSPRTVQSALDLLRSLKPQLDTILRVPVPATGLESAIAMSIKTRTDVDADAQHDTAPGRNQEASMTGAAATVLQQNPRQKSVLHVKLDKIDIMQTVGLPKAKVKGNRKLKQTVEPISVPSPSNSKTLIALSSTDIVKEKTSLSITSSLALKNDLADGADDVWANVMYLAPREEGEEGRKLRQVCDLIYTTFKRAGYLADSRPLKLHCTVLNTSKRKPAKLRGSPFCYSDVLASSALRSLGDTSLMDSKDGEENKGRAHEHEHEDAVKMPDMVTAYGSASKSNSAASAKTRSTCDVKPTPVPVNLGPCATVDVEQIGLWIMGSRGPNNEYISCGGVNLG